MQAKGFFYRYTLILIAAITASLLLTLSLPRLKASLRYLPVDTAISNYWETREYDASQLDGLVERAEESIGIHDHYRYWEGLSELQFLLGLDQEKSFWLRRQALERSITAAEESIKRAPTKPRNWYRIALAKEYLEFPADTVIPALKMSILSGRVEPTFMLPRLELGLRLLPDLDDEAKQLLRDQAILTWENKKGAFLQRIKTGAIDIESIRSLLAGYNPSILAEMDP